MLQKIRDNLEGLIAKVIIAIIAVPFAVFGVETFFTGGEPEAAVVNDQTITERELTQFIEMRRRALIQAQEKIDPALIEESALRQPVLDSLVDRALALQAAKAAGLRVSDAMVDETIVADENFKEGNEFSQTRFQALLGEAGYTPAFYRQLLAEEMVVSQLMSGISATEFVTTVELAGVARLIGQSVDVRYLTIPLAAVKGAVVVPEERIAAYYNENKDEFRTEDAVVPEYLELRLEDLFKPVGEAELRAEYDRRMRGYEGTVERHAAHIMLEGLSDDEAGAKLAALRERALKGEDFAVLAQQNSSDAGSASAGGDLGYSTGDAFPPEFETALATLKPGEISQPVKTAAGWHLVKLLDQRIQEQPQFAELRAAIEIDLQRAAAEPLFVDRSEQLADLSFNSADLKEAAAALGVEPKIGAPIGRKGGEGIFADKRVIEAAFSKEVLEDGQNSELVELGKEHVVVLRAKERRPARQLELAEVSERIRDLLRESMVRDQVRERGEAALQALRAGKPIDLLATEGGHAWQVALGHRRGSPDLLPEISNAVYSAGRPRDGESINGSVALPAGDVVVYEAANFRDGSVEQMNPEQKKSLQTALVEARGREIAQHYRRSLRDGAEIETP